MCETCGCSPGKDNFTVHFPDGHLPVDHKHHTHDGQHGHSHTENRNKITIELETEILSKNKVLANRNREFFESRKIKAYNFVSSPGSGKTTLLEKLIAILIPSNKVYVIEGDQQTSLDAERIKNAGGIAIQINTGKGCHLDAHMINHAIEELRPADRSILFIENVGNLICPSLFDLGEKQRIVVISVTEGEDKPLKYPEIFQGSDLCILNKMDLLPYLDFDVELFRSNLEKVHHEMPVFLLSAKNGHGLDDLVRFIQ